MLSYILKMKPDIIHYAAYCNGYRQKADRLIMVFNSIIHYHRQADYQKCKDRYPCFLPLFWTECPDRHIDVFTSGVKTAEFAVITAGEMSTSKNVSISTELIQGDLFNILLDSDIHLTSSAKSYMSYIPKQVPYHIINIFIFSFKQKFLKISVHDTAVY